MSYFLALDAGGTKVDYVLADDTQALARVRTGTVKRTCVDETTALGRLKEGLHELETISGISMEKVTRTCVGTAGQTIPLVVDWLRNELGKRVSGELLLLGDVEIALDAAFPGGGGVIALAGTGSNVAGRTCRGILTTAGGWGPALADQGSGHRIGQQALRGIFLAYDQGCSTSLLSAVLDFWSLESIEDLVAFANSKPYPEVSQLTGLVLRCATEGDSVASEVLHREGEDLAHLVILVMRRLLAAEPDHLPALAFAGSIMENLPPVREALIAAVHRKLPAVQINPGVVDPVQGALWRARTGTRPPQESRLT
jgi:N-acetylglucosamine kinase-like BadF-type ATPase